MKLNPPPFSPYYLRCEVIVILWGQGDFELFYRHIWSLVQTMVDCWEGPFSHHICIAMFKEMYLCDVDKCNSK